MKNTYVNDPRHSKALRDELDWACKNHPDADKRAVERVFSVCPGISAEAIAQLLAHAARKDKEKNV